MIGKLRGTLDSAEEDRALIDVGGVGYLVFCSRRTLESLGGLRQPVTLLIETHVREDHIHLYGFCDEAERGWFRLLGTIQGVGSRMALALLSTLRPEQLEQAILTQDKAQLTRAPGVGPKLAARLVTELKDRVARSAALDGLARPLPSPEGLGPSEDAVSALVNLGYRRAEAQLAVSRAASSLGREAGVETLIKAGLKELSA